MSLDVQKQPLILALKNDIHAAAINWGLLNNGIRPVWVSSLAENDIGPISLQFDDISGWKAKGCLDKKLIGGVWFRRPKKPNNFSCLLNCDRIFLREEWSLFQNNIYALANDLTKSLWINPPSSAYMSENKLIQLQAAHKCEISFPKTLVSNDSSEIKKFLMKYNPVVYKPFIPHMWKNVKTGQISSLWVRIIDSNLRYKDKSIELCPGIYQVYIEKKYDIRVTVIGDHLFAARLQPIADKGFVDWRRYQPTRELQVKPFTLPHAFQVKLKALFSELNIVFGCVDLTVDMYDNIYFLEVNQGGQFLFIEEMAESMPLLRAMCAMIAEGRTGYSLDTISNISYKSYIETDHYHEWRGSLKDKYNPENRLSHVHIERSNFLYND